MARISTLTPSSEVEASRTMILSAPNLLPFHGIGISQISFMGRTGSIPGSAVYQPGSINIFGLGKKTVPPCFDCQV